MIPFAHALASRGDLPIPGWLFGWAASIVLVVSFFALATAWRKPKFENGEWREILPRAWRVIGSRAVEILLGLISLGLLGFVVYAGFEGTEAADRNFALTFVYVTVWLGFPVLSAFLGDVFRPVNPWRQSARAVGFAIGKLTGKTLPHFCYPEELGRWPAAAALVAFVWLEIIYGTAGTSVSLSPEVVANATILYSAYTWLMMALFGVEKWSQRGEMFSVYFHMFSTLAAFEVREGKLGRRKALSGTTSWANTPGSLALVVTAIGVTTFDGAQEGALANAINWQLDRLADLGAGVTTAVRGADTLFLALVLLGVAAIYLTGIWGMRTVDLKFEFSDLRQKFTHTLIPIALAYLVAHYFSLFFFQEQAQFTFLLSDPLGTGTTNLFGTANYGIDYNAIGPEAIWYIQLGSLLAGHLVALTLAHDRAISLWSNIRVATRSQYWMLAMMVCFTSLGLFLLSFANE